MKVAFQELKKGDEFTDETGIMYRKIHENNFCEPRHEKTAMVINHPVLGGTEVLINPGVMVNKIVTLTPVGKMEYGDVFVSNEKYFFVKIINSNKNRGMSDVIDLYRHSFAQFYETDEHEVVGHIDLNWPAAGA